MAIGITLLMFVWTVVAQSLAARVRLPGSSVAKYGCLSLISGIVLIVVLASYVQATYFTLAVCAALCALACRPPQESKGRQRAKAALRLWIGFSPNEGATRLLPPSSGI